MKLNRCKDCGGEIVIAGGDQAFVGFYWTCIDCGSSCDGECTNEADAIADANRCNPEKQKSWSDLEPPHYAIGEKI